MKGVILSVDPAARLVDLSHEVPPQGVLEARFLLSNAFRFFPRATIFVAVVDPGVGTDRAVVAVETDRHVFLAPDNGLLGFLEDEGAVRRAFRITNRAYFLEPVSSTFHGRDIFAPAAGHLSRGVELARLGEETAALARIEAPAPRVAAGGAILGRVAAIDRFGNLITDVPAAGIEPGGRIEIRVGKTVVRRLARTYAEGANNGKPFAIVGSTGTLEISVNRGSAREAIGAEVGDPVRVRGGRR